MIPLLRTGLRCPGGEAGFLLPLSLSGALVLLLCSLSMQSLVLHTRQLHGAEASRRRSEDLLASRAHQLAAALQGPYSCLMPHPSSAWFSQPLPADCAASLDPEALRSRELWGQRVLLKEWRPSSAGGGQFSLQQEDGGLLRRYAITLAPIYRLQELG
jgi:hypothetical protein